MQTKSSRIAASPFVGSRSGVGFRIAIGGVVMLGFVRDCREPAEFSSMVTIARFVPHRAGRSAEHEGRAVTP
jgi:hypothetical protein